MKLRKNQGFTLVEVLVAMLIATTLMLAVVRLFTRIGETFDMNAEAMQLMESTRVALRFVKSDLTQAGYMGCLQTDVDITSKPLDKRIGTTTNRRPNSYWGVSGVDGGANPDTLSLFYMQDLDIRLLLTDATGSLTGTPSFIVDSYNVFDASGNAVIDAGDWLVVGDCAKATSFILTNSPQEIGAGGVGLGADAVLGNGNVSVLQFTTGLSFGGFFNQESQRSVVEGKYTPSAGGGAAMIGRYVDVTYLVGPSVIDSGATQSLFRLVNGEAPSTTNEIVRLVTDFQITYGIDTDDDGVADRTLNALAGETVNNKPVQVQVAITLDAENSSQELVNIVNIRNKGL